MYSSSVKFQLHTLSMTTLRSFVMTRPQILVEGNNLFDIEGAVNMLNKQLLTTDSLEVGHRAQNYVTQMK